MKAKEFTTEAALGTNPKRPSREGSRPDRGHEPQKRYVTDRKTGKQYDPEEEFDKLTNSPEFQAQMKRMATKEGTDGTADYTLGYPVDKEYVYTIVRNGKPDGGTYHSLEQAKRILGNMKKGRTPGFDQFKITRKPRSKMAGPKGVLPEQGVAESPDAPNYEHRRRGKSPSDLGGADAWYHRSLGPEYYGYEKGSREAHEYLKAYRDWDEGPSGGKQWDESQETMAEAMERMEAELAEHGKASRELCKSSKPDNELGASMLSSCKSQGLRARDGDKSHKLGKSAKSRVKVGGHKIKGRKYGGPLPDWS